MGSGYAGAVYTGVVATQAYEPFLERQQLLAGTSSREMAVWDNILITGASTDDSGRGKGGLAVLNAYG